jgi:hypothetical protein
MILKSAEQAAIDSPQTELFKAPTPRRQLRVISAIRNEPARKVGLHIPPHFRVPSSCVIAQTFRAELGATPHNCVAESLTTWETSGGRKLPPFNVKVAARKVGDEVFGLLSVE